MGNFPLIKRGGECPIIIINPDKMRKIDWKIRSRSFSGNPILYSAPILPFYHYCYGHFFMHNFFSPWNLKALKKNCVQVILNKSITSDLHLETACYTNCNIGPLFFPFFISRLDSAIMQMLIITPKSSTLVQ